MGRLLLFLTTFFISFFVFNAYPQSAMIFKGPYGKVLPRTGIEFFDQTKFMTGDPDDPSSVAKNAILGSLYIESDTGYLFRKLDNGSSTNWTRFTDGSGISLASGKMFIGDATNTATAMLISGEVTVSATGSATLNATSSNIVNRAVRRDGLGYFDTEGITTPYKITNSTFKAGSFEIQGFGINNGWLSDNIYYNGGFIRRANGRGVINYYTGGGYQIYTFSNGVAGGVSLVGNLAFNLTVDRKLGLNNIVPTAYLHLPAGTVAAGTAPLKINSGINLTVPEAGSAEFDGTNLYFTPIATRENFVLRATGTPAVDDSLFWNGTTFITKAIPIGAGSGVDLYLQDTAHGTIGGYFQLIYNPGGGAEVPDTNAVTLGTSPLLTESYATAITGLGGATIEAGTWEFSTWANTSSVGGGTQNTVLIRVYSRTTAGAETFLFETSTPVLTTTATQYNVETVQPAFVLSASTDMLVSKYYITNTSATSRNVTFYHNGTTRYSHIHTPLTRRHNDLAGLQGCATNDCQHLTTAQHTDAANALNKILPDGKIFIGSVTNTATAQQMIGDVTITSTGVATLSPLAKLMLLETGGGGDAVTITATASQVAAYSLILPADDGTSGYALKTDGSGNLYWSAISGMPSLEEGKIFIGDATNTATAMLISGDVTITSTGVATLSPLDQIVLNEIAGTETITVTATNNIASSYIFRLPPDDGTSGQLLTTDGSGNTYWSAVSGGSSDTQTLTNDNGGAITAGKVVYLKANGTSVDLADADSSGLEDFRLGVVKDASIASAGSGDIYTRIGTYCAGFSGLTIGKVYYISETAGSIDLFENISWDSGDRVYSIGRAKSATEIELNPRYEYTY